MLKQMKAWFFEHSLSQNPLTRILNVSALFSFSVENPLVETLAFMY